MHIAVYGGSFNPMHEGHLSIIRHLGADARFDEVRVVVSPQNPLKSPDVAGNSLQRLAEVRRIVCRHPEFRAVVDDVEFHRPAPHYMADTLDIISADNPGSALTLAIGGDSLADIRRWRSYRHILLDYGVIVFPREGSDLPSLKADLLRENGDYRIEIADAPLVNISSTLIREGKLTH